MSLRPRYSLLTLLVLTTLVAGGVKLWHGPHRVVEERSPGKQLEYSYTRTWSGEKIVQGPSIIRLVEPNGRSVVIIVTYFSVGQQRIMYYILSKRKFDSLGGPYGKYTLERLNETNFSASEQTEYQLAVERERKLSEQDPDDGLLWNESFDIWHSNQIAKDEFHEWVTHYEQLLNRPWESLIKM